MFVLFLILTITNHGLTTELIPKEFQEFLSFKKLYNGNDCGQSMTNRIIGGKEAELGQYPWMTRIGYVYDPAEYSTVDRYECGGAIISKFHILTAAHCSPQHMRNKAEWVQVRIGEHDSQKEEDCKGNLCALPRQDIDIKSHYCHMHYSKEMLQHDICILLLVNPITFNSFVQPICLPFHEIFRQKKFLGQNMEVSGWGFKDAETEEASDVLLFLKLPVVSKKNCSKLYKDNRGIKINRGHICVGGIKGKDSCKGDSGGPLMAPFSINGPPRYFVIGLVSFGESKCGLGDLPAVYTFVPRYIKWILKAVDKLEEDSNKQTKVK